MQLRLFFKKRSGGDPNEDVSTALGEMVTMNSTVCEAHTRVPRKTEQSSGSRGAAASMSSACGKEKGEGEQGRQSCAELFSSKQV